MSLISTITVATNGIAIILAISFIIITLWYKRDSDELILFALLLFMVLLWNIGSLLVLLTPILSTGGGGIQLWASASMELGFAGAILSSYGYTANLVSILTRWAKRLLYVGIMVLPLYYVVAYRVIQQQITIYELPSISTFFYALFVMGIFYLLWHFRTRIPNRGIWIGLLTFNTGQGIALLNPELETLSISVIMSSMSILLVSLAVVYQQLILPVRDSQQQITTMHNMSLAITGQLSLTAILDEIANQSGQSVRADGVAIFLRENNLIRIAAISGLPKQFIGLSVVPDDTLVWRVIERQKPIYLENYQEHSFIAHDFPYYTETFGAVICVPLIYANETIGALMVIVRKQGHKMQPEDISLLKMLGDQAAVAISHSMLFDQQRQLTQQIRNAHNQLQTLLSSTNNPVVAVDRSLNLIFANDAAERIFSDLRYTAQPINEILPSQVFPHSYRQVIADVKANRAHVYEVIIKERVYLAHLAPLLDKENITGWVVILNDVTDLKELDRIKSEMVRMTSHDLKNPLQAAVANLDLLADIVDMQDEDVAYSMQTIERQLDRMYRIISGVLDMERIREGKQTTQICHPVDVIQNAIHDMADLARQRNIDVIFTTPSIPIMPFQGDAGQFERAMSNLIENAIKFSQPSDQVIISVENTANGDILFAVQDYGVGIPEKDQPHVFDSFFRANQRGTEHITGTGLGLHLVKTIVENHKGTIWLESTFTRGTTFFIRVPSTYFTVN